MTSNRGFEAWGEILGDAMVAAALIDRLVHHATMDTLKGKSYRLRERIAHGSDKPRQRPGQQHSHDRRAEPRRLRRLASPSQLEHFSRPESGAVSVPVDTPSQTIWSGLQPPKDGHIELALLLAPHARLIPAPQRVPLGLTAACGREVRANATADGGEPSGTWELRSRGVIVLRHHRDYHHYVKMAL